MLLKNLQTISDDQIDVLMHGDKINAVGKFASDVAGQQTINFDQAIVFPGLINSHDHLDFNLFPQLGNKIYPNYVAWGDDIHRQNKDIINSILKIPKPLRIKWGLYKNLINGVTTVVNHGPALAVNNELISVFQECYSLHSVRLEKHWRLKVNRPLNRKWPFVIHIGEGHDDMSRREIDKLIKWNFCKRDIIGVHGIMMDEKHAVNFKALIWCPFSNYFLTGDTAQISRLKNFTSVLFGTDSTLSAGWNLWEHLRLARDKKMVTDEELYLMLNSVAAETWQMNERGRIEAGFDADIVVAGKKENMKGYDAYYALNPEDILMVVRHGNIRLFDAKLLRQVTAMQQTSASFSRIFINGHCKYVYGDVPSLMQQIKSYSPDVIFPFETEDN